MILILIGNADGVKFLYFEKFEDLQLKSSLKYMANHEVAQQLRKQKRLSKNHSVFHVEQCRRRPLDFENCALRMIKAYSKNLTKG